MPKTSLRGNIMPSSPIRKLTPYADAAEERGIKVYHLNIGQPDIASPQAALEAVKQAELDRLPYTASQGNRYYREKLVGYYAENKIQLNKDQILVTNGGSEAIHFGFLGGLNPGDEVIIPEPFYANYNGFATTADIKIVPIPSSIDDGFSLPDLSSIEEAVTSKTKAILVCNPNNPTGYVYDREELETLKKICLTHDLYLFSDEAYREFCYEKTHTSVLELSGLEENAVVFDTISKRYSACGGRLGALITRNEKLYETALKFAQARLSPPTYAQIFAEAATEAPPSYFEEVKEEYRARRDLMTGRLQKIKGVKCPVPSGAFYAIAKLPVKDTEHFCQWLLEDFSYKGATVMLAPASGFYKTSGLGKQEVRLAYVINQQELDAAMTCLEKALEQYPDREI